MTAQPDRAALLALELPPSDIDALEARAAAGELTLVATSGGPGAGKDAWAPWILRNVFDVDEDFMTHRAYADPLRDELNDIIAAALPSHARGDRQAAITTLAEQFRLSPTEATSMVTLLWERDRLEGLNAWRRKELDPQSGQLLRRLLQLHGTDIRRRQDPDYWVKRLVPRLAEDLQQGRAVYLTDVRETNEVAGVQALGGIVVRLDATVETRQARIADRDGYTPSPSELSHPIETALDAYDGFDVRVSNDGSWQDTGAALLEAFETHPALAS